MGEKDLMLNCFDLNNGKEIYKYFETKKDCVIFVDFFSLTKMALLQFILIKCSISFENNSMQKHSNFKCIDYKSFFFTIAH